MCLFSFYIISTMETNEGRAVKNYAVHQSMRIPVALHSNQSAMILLHTRRSPFLIKLTPRPGKCPTVDRWGICRKISGFCVMGFMNKTERVLARNAFCLFSFAELRSREKLCRPLNTEVSQYRFTAARVQWPCSTVTIKPI